jgi:Protein of unknown function (DUF3108)
MNSAAVTFPPPYRGLGRALLLLAVSLGLHALVISAMRESRVVPAFDAAPAPRNIDVALISEVPPAPPPTRRVAPGKPRPPAPPPSAATPPPLLPPAAEAPAAETPPTPVQALAPAVTADDPPAPGDSDASSAPTVALAAATPAADVALVHRRPIDPWAAARGMDLAAALSEYGGAGDALPQEGRYTYKVRDSRYSALSGTMTLEWHADAATRHYETRLRSTVFGIPLADIASSGSIERFGLAPERYVQKTGTRAPQATSLDWNQHVVTFSSRTLQRPAREGTQDRLSFQFQLMALGQVVPNAFNAGATVSMDVAGPGDVEAYHFVVVGPEPVETGAGAIATIKLDRPKGDGADTRIEVWLAPAWRYLPVRLRFTDKNGNVTESVLESADGKG